MSFRPPRSLPILTLFHNYQSEKSKAALALLQSKQKNARGDDVYRIDIIGQNEAPTDTQLNQVASFLGSPNAWKDMVQEQEVESVQDALHVIQANPGLLRRPIVVDWEKGKAAMGSRTIEQLIQERSL
ncbi:hypothetical protein A0J61_07410 [Choanephora cucurbitarum]|uniref:Arsenate reductase n=1 Tax=Choanephora cucurbitarum TaxID=101091 RepID=A0A1C7N693_9FUNG|nr:hypothetical protein A0J61_07410 [Choanephora cucurbitarum]